LLGSAKFGFPVINLFAIFVLVTVLESIWEEYRFQPDFYINGVTGKVWFPVNTLPLIRKTVVGAGFVKVQCCDAF
jgi:hypothetical protein